MIALNKIIAAVCLINCSMHAMHEMDDDNDVADVSSAMQQMNLADEDLEFRDAYANKFSIAAEDAYAIQNLDQMMQYAQKGCGTLPIKEALEPHMKDLFDDDFKSRILGNMHSQELQHGYHVLSVVFDPSGARLATGSIDSKARIFKRIDNGTWQREQELPHDYCVRSVAFDPSGALLTTGSGDRKARIFKRADNGTWQCIQELQHGYHVRSVAFNPSGALLATVSNDGKAHIFKLKDGNWQCIQKLQHGGCVFSVAFDPSGALLATGGRDSKAHIFKLAALKQAQDILLIPKNEKQNDLLQACQIAMRHKQFVHVTNEQLETFNRLPERMQNALKQFIVTKEQYDRIKQKYSTSAHFY